MEISGDESEGDEKVNDQGKWGSDDGGDKNKWLSQWGSDEMWVSE